MQWGPEDITRTAGTGWFWCPTCREQQHCRHQVVMRWYHMMGKPLFPLKTLGEYIECQVCEDTFDLEVIHDPGSGGTANFQKAARHLMAKMVLADGKVEEDERKSMATIHLMVAGGILPFDDVDREIEDARNDPRSIAEYCADVLGHVNDAGKRQLLRSAYMIALSDGEYHDDERALLREIATALAVDEETLDTITGELMMFEQRADDPLVEAPEPLEPVEIP